MRPAPARGRGGFTLLELVISSSLVAGILGAAYLCLEASFRTQRLVEARMDLSQTARAALALLAADLRAACPLERDLELVGMDRTLGEEEADNLDFATHRWEPRAPGEGDLCEVSWFVDRDPRSGGLSLYRRRDPSPDDRPFEGGSREEIASGVLGFRLEYYDGWRWYDEWGQTSRVPRPPPEAAPGSGPSAPPLAWGNLYGMPEAVRITLKLGTAPGFPEKPGTAPGLPGSRRSAAQDAARREPPLVFQTVVHLNLARRASLSSGSGGGGSGAAEGDAAAAPAREEG